MNKREAKLRALKLCHAAIERAIAKGDIINWVDDDTPDDEAQRISESAQEYADSLQKRIEMLEAIEHGVALDGGKRPAQFTDSSLEVINGKAYPRRRK